MTRFARAGKRKFLEATSWEDLSRSRTNAKSPPQNDDNSLSSKKMKMVSKRKKVITHKSCVSKIALDPKKQKQIEARRLRRKKRKCCFVCREYGHQALECPKRSEVGVGSCFKCGSSDHTTKKCKATTTTSSGAETGPFPFAKCFICQENGHLARSCPENPRGLYPQGGGCKMCGSVEHLKRDCPQLLKKKNKGNITESVSLTASDGSTHKSADADNIVETDILKLNKKHGKRKEKVVNF